MATGISTLKYNVEKGLRRANDEKSPTLSYPGKAQSACILAEAKAANGPAVAIGSSVTNGRWANRLHWGENLVYLQKLCNDPEIVGKVTLCYIDPPFSTNASYESRAQEVAYHDVLSGSHFIEFLRQRIILIHELLSSNGSFYLHLDSNMVFEAKIVLDEIFGRKNFRSFITRKKCNTKNYTKKTYGNISDYLLFYTKGEDYVWNRPLDAWDDERMLREYNCIEDDGRRFKKVPVHAPGIRNGATGGKWKGRLPPPGKHWQYTPDKLTEMDNRGEIYWSPNGNPRRKVYFENSGGIPVQDIWMDMKDAHNQNIHITGYPTEKNSEMITRIVEASSSPSDIVLDCFAGSGTTLDVAGRLARKWIGCDLSALAIKTTVKRLFHGAQPMGDFVNPHRSGAQEGRKSPGSEDRVDGGGFIVTADSSLMSSPDFNPTISELSKLGLKTEKYKTTKAARRA